MPFSSLHQHSRERPKVVHRDRRNRKTGYIDDVNLRHVWSKLLIGRTDASNTNTKHQDNYNLTMLFTENLTQNRFNDNLTSSRSNDVILVLLDRSQLIMTIIGVIANIGTSITLIKNGQVSVKYVYLKLKVDNLASVGKQTLYCKLCSHRTKYNRNFCPSFSP